MNYFNLHIGDWTVETAYLNRIERDIYMQMLLHYYREEKPLCMEISELEKIFSIKEDAESEALCYLLHKYFYQEKGQYHHTRCDKEIAHYKEKSQKAKKAAEKRWDNKSNANALLTNNQKPITNNQFIKPSVDEVAKYIEQKTENAEESAQEFVNYYESKGWVVGKVTMKNWKSCATNWVNRQQKWKEEKINEKKQRNINKRTTQEKRHEALIQLQ